MTNDTGIKHRQHVEIDLPGTAADARIIILVDKAVPEMLRGEIRWSARTSEGKDIIGHDVNDFLVAMAKEPVVDRFSLSAHGFSECSYHNMITLICWSTHSILDCSFEMKNEMEFDLFVSAIKGIFSEDHQVVITSPDISEEPSKRSFWSSLDRRKIAEDIIARVGSHLILALLLSLPLAAGMGYVIGRIWS